MFWSKKKKETQDTNEVQQTNSSLVDNGPTYILELHLEGVDPQEVPVEGELIIGSSEAAHISIEGADLISEHATIKLQDSVLYISNNAPKGSYIGEQLLQEHKKYILSSGDTIRLGAATILIKRVGENAEEEHKEESEIPADTKNLLEDDLPSVKTEARSPHATENSDITTPTITSVLKDKEQLKENARKEQKILNEILKKNKEKQEQPPEKILTKRFKLFKGKPPIDPSSRMKQSFVKGSFFPLDQAPGALTRFYAILLNLSFVYAIIYTLLPIFDHAGILEKELTTFIKILIPQIEKIVNFTIPKEYIFLVNTISKFYLLHCVLDLLWAILFGISLPLRLLGLTIEDSFFIARFKGIFRSIIGIFTTPTILFDLPILFGYKSLKELLTITQLTYRSRLLRYASVFLLFPLLILLCFASPVMNHLENFTTMTFDPMKVEQEQGYSKKIPKTATTTESASVTAPVEINWQVHSELFGVKTELRFPESLIILPITNKGILFLDKNKDSVFSQFNLKTEVNLKDLLYQAPDGNPLFFLLFGSIHHFIESNNQSILQDPEITKDFNRLLGGAFQLTAQMIKGEDTLEDITTAGRYLIEYGPFLGGYLNVRDSAITKLGITSGNSVALLNQKINDFIRISPNPSTLNYALIVSPGQKTPIFEYKTSQSAIKLGMKVIHQLLDGNWNPLPNSNTGSITTATTATFTTHLTQMEKENALSMVDYLNNLKKNPDQPIFEAIIVSNFFRNEFEKIRDLPPNSILVKKFSETVNAYAQEIRQFSKPDDATSQQLITELELIAKGELPPPTTASQSVPALEPTPIPTPTPPPTPTATPKPEPVKNNKKKGRK